MALLLQIDTASAVASVSIARHGIVIDFMENNLVNEHASFLQPAIKTLLASNNMVLADFDAIAVVNGPGSYTGLRVGMASAKGLSYALNKPLITIGTLPVMAHAAAQAEKKEDILYAPMIDARRMEVFTAVYNAAGEEKIPAGATVLNNDSFVAILLPGSVLFFGSGAQKWKNICTHPNALFSSDYSTINAMAKLSFDAYALQKFATLAYSEPLYLKEFYTGI